MLWLRFIIFYVDLLYSQQNEWKIKKNTPFKRKTQSSWDWNTLNWVSRPIGSFKRKIHARKKQSENER